MGIEDAKQKRALLLHYSGSEVDEIFDTLEDTGEDKDYKKAVEKLTAHFNPQVNTTYEVYNFRKAQQNEGESFDGLTAEYPSTNLHKNSVYCILTRSSKNAAKFKPTLNVVNDKKKSEKRSKKGKGCRRGRHSGSRSGSHKESR